MSRDAEPCVAVICPCGGFTIVAVRKYLTDEDKADIGNYAAEGYEIRQTTAAECRVLSWCSCERFGQVSLDLGATVGGAA